MSENFPTLLNLFPVKEDNDAMENVSSTITTTVADKPAVSTALSLSLYPTPVVAHRPAANPPIDLSAVSVWCFNFRKTDQEPPLPTMQQPSTTLSLLPCATIKDYLRTKNHPDLSNIAELIDAGSSLSLSLPMKYKTQKKQENSSNLIVAKKQKATGLRLEVENHWINKRLSLSDVDVSSRLLLPKDEIRKYVLPMMDVEKCAACESRDGLRVKIWDMDSRSEHELSLKQWKTGSFLLTSNWKTEFVNRRSLKEGDSIWLSWDFQNRRFLFHKFSSPS